MCVALGDFVGDVHRGLGMQQDFVHSDLFRISDLGGAALALEDRLEPERVKHPPQDTGYARGSISGGANNKAREG